MFVQWEAPKHLKNLMGYYVDGRVVGAKEWFPCNHKPFKHTRWSVYGRTFHQNQCVCVNVCACSRFVVHGLIPGETYVFRVQAANMFGLSEESQESSPIAVEPALGESGVTLMFSCHSLIKRVAPLAKRVTHVLALSRRRGGPRYV